MSLDAWLTICIARPVCDELKPALEPMNKVEPLELPPLARGLATVMLAVPGVRMSLAGIVACNCVLETKVVASADPLNCAVAAGSNCVPVTVNRKAGLLAMAELGNKDVIVGAFGNGVGGIAGFGGGDVMTAGAGPAELPPNEKTWPLPLSPLLMNARPSCPHRIRWDNIPATFGMVTEPIGVKCIRSNA